MRRCGSGTPLLVGARLDPVGRLQAGGVGQPADGEVREPLGDVRLDLHEGALEPGQGDRAGAAQAHPDTPRTWRSAAGPRCRAQDPDHVDAHRRRPQVVIGQPGGGEPSQPRGLAPGHGLDRLAERGGAARLDLAHDEAVAVEGDQVDLAVLAPPVAVEDLPCPGR